MRDMLITGATGFMGRALAAELLRKSPNTDLWALVRASAECAAEDRPELAKLIGHPRFHVIEGDVRSPGLGVERNARVPEFDTCFHLAAATDFREANRELTFATNVRGTQNVLEFLRGSARRPRLYHVSTAFVQWQGRDRVAEELLCDGPYSNAYEESKHLAERAVAESDADWVILRPSILVGHSRTGESESDKMAYGALRSYWAFREFLRARPSKAGAAPGPFRVLCAADIRRNFLCVDDAARLTAAIAVAHPPARTIVHVVNPVTTDMHQCSEAALECLDFESIALTPTINGTLCSEERMLARNLHPYEAYMTMQEPHFDLANLRSIVGDAAVDSTTEPTPRMLRFLFGAHLVRVLEPRRHALRGLESDLSSRAFASAARTDQIAPQSL